MLLIAIALQAAIGADARVFAACRAAAVAPCYTQRGSIVVGNGAYPIRFGTVTRPYRGGAVCHPGRVNACESIAIATPRYPRGAPISAYALTGRYTYCPIRPRRAGHLTIGCLAAASRLRYEPAY